ncbi:MAG: hypothetical protein [Bacteriophage sp.]|nr:MAG: hypothetical protein [Bacteriophage sp.]
MNKELEKFIKSFNTSAKREDTTLSVNGINIFCKKPSYMKVAGGKVLLFTNARTKSEFGERCLYDKVPLTEGTQLYIRERDWSSFDVREIKSISYASGDDWIIRDSLSIEITNDSYLKDLAISALKGNTRDLKIVLPYLNKMYLQDVINSDMFCELVKKYKEK